jgi:hypothetical protein
MKKFVCFVILLLVCLNECRSFIDEKIKINMKKNSLIDIVVHLSTQTDYRKMKLKGKSFDNLDIDTKAMFIHEQLVSHSTYSQKHIIDFLTRHNVKYTTLWLTNSKF